MKRWTMSFVFVVLASAPVSAHFVWIVPDKPADGKTTARVIFSENLQPDNADFLGKIASTQLFARDGDGKITAVKWKRGDNAYQTMLSGTDASILAGVCRYGVLQRGKSEPFLLMYYPKALLASATPSVANFHDACERLPLEIVPVKDKTGMFRVLWQGKPLADAEIVALVPGKDGDIKKKSDAKGLFQLSLAAKGVYGIRVRHVEAKTGEHDGKKYQSVRHYATLVFRIETIAAQP